MAKRRRRPRKGIRILDVLIYLFLAVLLVGAGFAAAVVVSAIRDLPALANLEPSQRNIDNLRPERGHMDRTSRE